MGLRADLTADLGQSEESWEALSACGFGDACDGGGVEGDGPELGGVEDVGVDFAAQFAGETEEGGEGIAGGFHRWCFANSDGGSGLCS